MVYGLSTAVFLICSRSIFLGRGIFLFYHGSCLYPCSSAFSIISSFSVFFTGSSCHSSISPIFLSASASSLLVTDMLTVSSLYISIIQ